MDNSKKNSLNLDDDKIREIERKMSQSSNVVIEQAGSLQGVNIVFPKEMAVPQNEAYLEKVQPVKDAPKTPGTVVKNLRTFQGDVAEVIKGQNASVLTIALAEKKKQDKQNIPPPQQVASASPQQIISTSAPVFKEKAVKKPLDPDLKKNIILGIISVVLIGLGVGSVYGFYILHKNDGVFVETPVEKSILSWNTKASIDTSNLKRNALIDKINFFRESASLGNGEVLYISFEKQTTENLVLINTTELFKILETQASAPLQRSFGKFMFGFLGSAGSKEPFLLVELDSFDLAFSGMLSWEKSINDDIGSIFTRRVLTVKEVPAQTASSTQATTTSSSATQTRIINFDNPNPEGFEDVTIRNKDARVLKNIRGETIMLYSFIDRKFLLLTSSEDVLSEIINKLIADQQIR